MIRSRLGLKALVLSGLLLGLMAFAGSAQAETNANWMVAGSNVTGPTNSIAVSELENNTASLLLTLKSGTKVEFLCTSVVLSATAGGSPKLDVQGKITPGIATFHGCLTKLNGVVSKNCEPFSGANKGLILSLEAKGLIVLHEGEPVTQLSPPRQATSSLTLK